MSRLAFVDESFKDASGRTPGYYQLAAALVDGASVSTLRVETVAAAPRQGFHASTLANRGRQRDVESMLDHVARSESWNVIVVTAGHLGSSEPARQRCLASMLELMDGQKITHVIADSREATLGNDPQARNRVDLTTLKTLRTSGAVSRHMTLAHEHDNREPLLYIPDAVGWAYRQYALRSNPHYWGYVSSVSTVHQV